MRVGMVGLAGAFYPVAIGKALQAREEVEFVGAATLGASEGAVRDALGISPQEYAARFGLRLYEDPEEMARQERLDTVVLTTRHTEHAHWAERMAALGLDMYIPKTFATTLADAERIVAAQQRYGVRIATGPSARFFPELATIKRALDQGLIGRPFALRLCHHHGTIDVFGRADWYRDAAEGGPELSLGWYGVDLVLHLMGRRVVSVFAEYGNYTSADSPFMDCGRMTLRLEDGALASFDMYFCIRAPYPSWQVEVLGPQGVLSVHAGGAGLTESAMGFYGAEGYRALPAPEGLPGWDTAWVAELLPGGEPSVPPSDALLITRICLAARESAQKGCPVALV